MEHIKIELINDNPLHKAQVTVLHHNGENYKGLISKGENGHYIFFWTPPPAISDAELTDLCLEAYAKKLMSCIYA